MGKQMIMKFYPTVSKEDLEAGWRSMRDAPDVEGPYLIKMQYEGNYKANANKPFRYRIKRWNIIDDNRGGYFTRGDVSKNGTFLAWMPIPNHNY